MFYTSTAAHAARSVCVAAATDCVCMCGGVLAGAAISRAQVQCVDAMRYDAMRYPMQFPTFFTTSVGQSVGRSLSGTISNLTNLEHGQRSTTSDEAPVSDPSDYTSSSTVALAPHHF